MEQSVYSWVKIRMRRSGLHGGKELAMKGRREFRLLKVLGRGCVLCACLLLPFAAAAEELRIGGTGNALGTMRLLGEAFVRLHPEHKVVVLPSIGSSGAIKAVPRGALDVGVSARPLNEAEKAAGVVAIEYARTPTVLAVSRGAAVREVTRDQLVAIFAGTLTRWPDGTPIRPVLRQPGDDNTRQLKSLTPLMEQALGAAEQRAGLPFAVIDQEAADKIETIPGAIGVTALSLILSEERGLRPLALDGVEPSVSNAAAGSYPLSKRFFVIVRPEPAPAVRSFVEFLRSAPAREILARTGHWLPDR
jgi:phosphate transport system substrate-binding protein